MGSENGKLWKALVAQGLAFEPKKLVLPPGSNKDAVTNAPEPVGYDVATEKAAILNEKFKNALNKTLFGDDEEYYDAKWRYADEPPKSIDGEWVLSFGKHKGVT